MPLDVLKGEASEMSSSNQHRSFSKFNINGDVFLNHQKIFRPRQNSVFVGSSMVNLPMNVPRKVKSAFDLQSLVLSDPALNKSGIKLNNGAEYLRRSSLFPPYQKKLEIENPSGERRLSFKDLVDIERFQRLEKVQCHVEPESESVKRNRKIGETKQRSTVSNQSSLSDSRHNSITIHDKPSVSGCSKVPAHDRRSSLLPGHRDFGSRDPDGSELRPEVKSGVNNFRRNSMLIINSLENERNFLTPRENIRSGVHDFRRNSMLIINNLTEDIGYRSMGRNYSLGGSNMALGADFSLIGRRNSVIPPFGYEAKQKLSIPYVTVPKPKTTKPLIHSENKYMSNHKSSKSLDCGDGRRTLSWKNVKEASQPSLFSEAKQQFLTPKVPQNFAGSSASLNTDYGHRDNKSMEESRSTGNLNTVKSDFINPKIVETKCYSPNTDDTGPKLNLAPSNEDIEVLEEVEMNGLQENFESKPPVNLTTSLTNLNINSAAPLNVVTSSTIVNKSTNAIHLSHV